MSNKGKGAITEVKNAVIKQLDQNGNGELDIADVIALSSLLLDFLGLSVFLEVFLG